MEDTMNTRTLNNVILALSVATGGGLFGYSLMQQTELQGGMNDTMTLINRSIAATGQLVQETSVALDPLAATTAGLAQIEQREEQTVQHLNVMNEHLAKTADYERTIIHGLEALNGTTSGVGGRLDDMKRVVEALNRASGGIETQSTAEDRNVQQLNEMTQTSIDELRRLNDKLAPLRLLP
jgi:hypothetical protein